MSAVSSFNKGSRNILNIKINKVMALYYIILQQPESDFFCPTLVLLSMCSLPDGGYGDSSERFGGKHQL